MLCDFDFSSMEICMQKSILVRNSNKLCSFNRKHPVLNRPRWEEAIDTLTIWVAIAATLWYRAEKSGIRNRYYYIVDHTPPCRSTAAAQTHHCNGEVLALLKRWIYWQRTDLVSRFVRSRLGGLLSRPLEIRGASRRGCISMATLVCAHRTSILTNCGLSELVAERIFYALQIRTRTIIL